MRKILRRGNEVINLYPEMAYETFEGFGGAITDAAGYVYAQMNEIQKKEVIDTYFNPEKMNYTLVRIHMDSCDFSQGCMKRCLMKMIGMKSFSFERTEKYIMPMLKDAAAAAGNR